MDNVEASCVFFVRVGTFTQLEQSKICILTGNKTGIVRLNIQHDWIVIVNFKHYPRDCLKQTSPDILSLEGCSFISDVHMISAVMRLDLSLETNIDHQTD